MIKLELAELLAALGTVVEILDRHPVGAAMLIVMCAMGLCIHLARR